MIRRPASVFAIVAFLTTMVILPGAPAPTVQAAPQKREVPQVKQIQIPPATLRTMDEMLADQATHPFAPGAARAVPFRPGMDPAAYAAAKKAAAAAPRVARRAVPTVPGAPSAATILNCDGEDQIRSANFGFIWAPPDADGTFGFSPTAHTLEFVQVTNGHLTVWDAAHAFFVGCSTARLFDVSLNSFFAYTNQALFDPRVVHDDTYGRWVISAEAFPQASGAQFQFLAVSVSDDARGPYFEFAVDTTALTCAGCFWDFPQLGMDDQAVILTANVFAPSGAFSGSRWFFLNKQHLYYGLGLTGCFFFGGIADLPSWAPPKVLDLETLTWMVEAQPVANFLQLASLEATGQICPTVVSIPFVFVFPYSVPNNATQPGTTQLLDTLDARFQNRSTQVGLSFLGQTLLWNVHTEGPGLATPVLFRINTVALTVQESAFFTSGSSADFNPSIAANLGNTIAVTWSSTDAGVGVNAQVRAGRCAGAAAVCSPGSGLLVFQSSVHYNGFRWGDYSYAAIDGSGNFGAGVNEEINNPDDASGNTWGTRFYVATFP